MAQVATQWLLSFFSSLFTVFLNKTNCIWSWVLLLFCKMLGKNAFFSMSLFLIYQCRKENVSGCLGEFGLIWRNPQCDCLPKAHLSLESSSFSLLLPPRRQQQGGCSPCLGCSSQGHHLLLWWLMQELKECMDFPSDLQSVFELTC